MTTPHANKDTQDALWRIIKFISEDNQRDIDSFKCDVVALCVDEMHEGR